MKKKIQSVLIIVNFLKKDAEAIIKDIREYLEKKGLKVKIFGFRGKPGVPDLKDIDFAFSLGGDGTVLYSSRILSPKKIPILAVNMGEFGFITEVSKYEWQEAFDKYQRGTLGISERFMLKVTVERGGKFIESFIGLNDAVISAKGRSKLIKLKFNLKGAEICHYRADGIIISSPTGSTAYSAAAGGPILDPEMEAMIVNPICPFTLSNRPIVVPGDEVIQVVIEEQQRTEVVLLIDGQIIFPLNPNDKIIFTKADHKSLIIRSDKRNFYEVLRSKLNWAGGA